jgi:hypothetical protein
MPKVKKVFSYTENTFLNFPTHRRSLDRDFLVSPQAVNPSQPTGFPFSSLRRGPGLNTLGSFTAAAAIDEATTNTPSSNESGIPVTSPVMEVATANPPREGKDFRVVETLKTSPQGGTVTKVPSSFRTLRVCGVMFLNLRSVIITSFEASLPRLQYIHTKAFYVLQNYLHFE